MSNKIKFTCEFPIRCSPHVLYDFFISANALGEWFADQVDQHENEYTFYWNGSMEKAILIESHHESFVRYRWETMGKGEYFEFRIEQNDLTSNTIIIVTDFAEKKDVQDSIQLWETQLTELKHRIGS
jgi:START-like superfamily domain